MMYLTMAVIIIGSIAMFWYVSAYNRLVRGFNAVELTWSNVEVDLKRRLNLISNLVETVKGYAHHEQVTFEEVSRARSQAGSAGSPGQAMEAQGLLTSAVRSLYAVVEDYPELKANKNFQHLHEQLVETEDRIAERRHAYNQSVKLFTDQCQMFPTNLIAWCHNFRPQPFFDAPDDEIAVVPRVSFV